MNVKEENEKKFQIQKQSEDLQMKEKHSDIAQLNLKIDHLETKLAHNVKTEARIVQDLDLIKTKASGLEIQCQNYENTIEDYKVNVLLLQSKLSSHESSFDQLMESLDCEKNK